MRIFFFFEKVQEIVSEEVTNQNFIKIQIEIYFIFHILFSCNFIFNFFFEFLNPVNKLNVGIIKLLKLLILS